MWGQSRNVEIHRKDPNDSIGLVSVAVQVSRTLDYFICEAR